MVMDWECISISSVITQKQLKDLLNYNPSTGSFTWRITKSNRNPKGGKADSKHNCGYLAVRINNKAYLLHRLAWLYMTGEWPKNHIDHINHNRADNRWLNLREADHKINSRNLKLNPTNKSGVCGVGWDKVKNNWRAYIRVDYKSIHLGNFNDKFEAVCARKSANNKYSFHANHGM